MPNTLPIEPIDYLIIGHIVKDIVPGGYTLGGTASYASLTARAMGLRVGIVTAIDPILSLPELDGISICAVPSEYTSTFENIYTPDGRIQYLHHRATSLDISMVPDTWKNAPIVHLGPLCQEVDPKLVRAFPNSIIGITPQGWMRRWDENNRVSFSEWYESRYVLENASAAVLSIEDIECDESRVEDMLTAIRILVVTEGAKGARLYWNGDLRYFRPPQIYQGDATGAGDIFAAAFFARFAATHDPWEAARLATQLASHSVTRMGLSGVPTTAEVQENLVEVV